MSYNLQVRLSFCNAIIYPTSYSIVMV